MSTNTLVLVLPLAGKLHISLPTSFIPSCFFSQHPFFSRNVFTDNACLSKTLQKSSIQEAPSSCSHCRCIFVDHRLFVLSCTQQNTFRGINLLLTIWTALWSPWSCLASALTGCSHTLPSSAQCGATPNEERKIKSLQNVQQLSTNVFFLA